MSIKGIDTQLMITRATDFVKETSNIQRHPEQTQAFTAAQTKAESTHDQSRVKATNESEMDNVRTDADGSGSGAAGGGGSGRGEDGMTDEQRAELLVAPAAHDQLIDIVV